MLHNDTPKFTIPTTTSFSKSSFSLSLHFEPREEDEPRGRRIVDSRTRRWPIAKNRRRIGGGFFSFSLSLCTQGRWTRISEADDSAATHASYATNTTRCARDISRTRLTLPRTHACDLVHATVFFSSLLFFSSVGLRNRLVSGDGISYAFESGAWNRGKFEFF